MMIVTTQKLTDDQKATIDKLVETCNAAIIAFKDASHWRQDSIYRLWDAVHEMYPDLKQYDLSYDKEEGRLVIMGYKRRRDD